MKHLLDGRSILEDIQNRHHLKHRAARNHEEDKNGSKSAIRNFNNKQKVSTQSKSGQPPTGLTTSRSEVDAAIKQGRNVLEALRDAA